MSAWNRRQYQILYIHYVFSCTYIPVIKLNLYVRQSKRLTAIIKWVIITIYYNENYMNVSLCLCILFTIFTFSLKGSTLQLLFGVSEWPASHSCVMGPLVSKVRVTWKQVLRYYSLSDNREVSSQGRGGHGVEMLGKDSSRPQAGYARFHHATQNSRQLKTYKVFTCGIFRLIFSGRGWPRVTETTESETTNKGKLLYGDRAPEILGEGHHSRCHF